MRNGAKLAVLATTAVLAGSGGGLTVALARASVAGGIGAQAVVVSATRSQPSLSIRIPLRTLPVTKLAVPKLAPSGTASGRHAPTRSIWV